MPGNSDSIVHTIRFIETHLREDVAVEDIAAQAARYSPFHFIRLFRVLVGETPGGYLRKRRLSEAASELVHTRKSVLQLALEYRFRSAEAFTHSFKRQFGLSPSQQRRTGQFLHLVDPVQAEQIGVRSGSVLEPRFFSWGTLHFAGLAYHGDNSGSELSAVWTRFSAMIPQVAHPSSPPLVCGIWEYPRSFQNGRDFDYTAAVQVDRREPLPPGLSKKTLPANRYAVFTHTGPLRLIRQSYVYIYTEWLPNSGCEQAGPYDMEIYDDRFLGPEMEDSALNIAIPIKK